MSKSKTLKMKLVYIVAAVAMLAMLIPAMAVPVSAQTPHLEMYIENPLLGGYETPDAGHNITGSIVRVVPVDLGGATVTNWTITPYSSQASFVGTPVTGAEGTAEAYVQGGYGEATIAAVLSEGPTITIDKKWGQIAYTEFIDDSQSMPVTWNESAKKFEAYTTVTDTVYGDFINKDDEPVLPEPAMQGVILNWYLIDGHVNVDMSPGFAPNLKAYVEGLAPAYFVSFTSPPTEPPTTYQQTVSDSEGASTVDIYAVGEEAVKVVVIPEYPAETIQVEVTPEVAMINFWTREMEKVPQVRWAGEKIVLEKNFGVVYAGQLARFALENQSPGALEGYGPAPEEIGLNLTNTNDTVWTEIDENGFASCIVVCEDMGEVDVDVALYDTDNETIINEHGFVVFYIKLESLTLGNVVGKRDGHDSGLWDPANPWAPVDPFDPTSSDTLVAEPPATDLLTETLNVSADALLRARVKGWFTNSNPSVRPLEYLDMDQDGEYDLTLPAGRWVLPDDWRTLAGPNWKSNRLHWDIMDNPYDSVMASNPKGSYYMPYPGGTMVAEAPVIGPFSPGIELMTPLGWMAGVTGWDNMETGDAVGIFEKANREVKTVVPNGMLEWWDAPMPPAKIVYEIIYPETTTSTLSETAGYFKNAYKDDIYYLMVDGIAYTNPFYYINIPAHWAIPAFINNGGYDWDTFGESTTGMQEYGPYPFWKAINQPDYTAPVPTSDPTNRPTKVEVYSDNHGEAMVYLNGNWNLDLSDFQTNGAADIMPGEIVGFTTVQAMADYPYLRKHQAILSNTIQKTWVWGGQVLGADSHLHPFKPANAINPLNTRMVLTVGTYTIDPTSGEHPNQDGTSTKKMAWIWVTDRDGRQNGVNGDTVEWSLSSSLGSAVINWVADPGDPTGETPLFTHGVSDYTPEMENIDLEGGFLANSGGHLTDEIGFTGVCDLRPPTDAEAALFLKFWGPEVLTPGLNPADYVVAAIEIYDASEMDDVDVTAKIISDDYGLQPGEQAYVIYRTNVDFTMADPLDDPVIYGDANIDGEVNMGDVTAVERIILGLKINNSSADANLNGKTDMGDVIKIERMILGL